MRLLLSVCLLLLAPAPFLRAQGLQVNLRSFIAAVSFAPGQAAELAWTFGGTVPGPLIRVTEGQPLRVVFTNDLTEGTTLHMHGQPLPLELDGTADFSRPEVATGQERRYEFDSLDPGTYLYHPHPAANLHQLGRGLYGVLIVDPANPATDPPSDVDQVIVLDDWLQPFGGGFNGHLINGRTSLGQQPIQVNQGERLRLRFVNAASETNYVVALDGHTMEVTHCDGHRIQPVTTSAIPIGIGERYDVIVTCNNFGMWSLAAAAIQDRTVTLARAVVSYSGATGTLPAPSYVPAALSSGPMLSYSQLASLNPNPINTLPNFRQGVTLDAIQTGAQTAYGFNGQVWPTILPTQVASGDDVQYDLQATSPEYVPLHLHGHSFKLLGVTSGVSHAPRKDSLLVWPAGQSNSQLSIQFRADNEGYWLLHSSDTRQWGNGMIAAIEYTGDTDTDGISDGQDLAPRRQGPVTLVPSTGTSYSPGSVGTIRTQWQPNQSCTMLISLFERTPAAVLPPHGTLYLQALSSWAVAVGDAQGYATFPYALPNDPLLRGFQFYMQPMCSTQMLGGFRLGSLETFRFR